MASSDSLKLDRIEDHALLEQKILFKGLHTYSAVEVLGVQSSVLPAGLYLYSYGFDVFQQHSYSLMTWPIKFINSCTHEHIVTLVSSLLCIRISPMIDKWVTDLRALEAVRLLITLTSGAWMYWYSWQILATFQVPLRHTLGSCQQNATRLQDECNWTYVRQCGTVLISQS